MSSHTIIESVKIRGFRSLADIELDGLGRRAILVGANGSGKSNFIRFFQMLRWMIRSRRLAAYVQQYGGADDQLYGGSRRTQRIEASISLRTDTGRNEYRFALSRVHPGKLVFAEEAFRFCRSKITGEVPWESLPPGSQEASIAIAGQPFTVSQSVNPLAASVIVKIFRSCEFYQFHDTSDNSRFKIRHDIEDRDFLSSDGGNLAAVLYRLEHQDTRRFDRICYHIGRVVPAFDRFVLNENYGKVLLRWKAKGSDKSYGPHLTSDGSLRFFALATLLNLPTEMLPEVIFLDEPELGLHPFSIALVGGMIRSMSVDRQVIVSTQSPLLVNTFEVDDIVVFEHEDDRTLCRRLDSSDYTPWLEDGYLPGDLWWKGLFGGYP